MLQRIKGGASTNAGELHHKLTLIRLAGSIIIAEQIANATFLLGDAQSEHLYSSSDLLNAEVYKTPILLGKSCIISDYLPTQDRNQMVRAACAGRGRLPARALDLQRKLASCSVILDDMPPEVYEDLNGCYRDWIRARLGGLVVRRLGSKKTLSVGIHIRWGDAAQGDGTTFRGSRRILTW